MPPFTLDTAEGPLLDALRDARSLTRFGLLDSMTEIRDFERRFAPGGGSIELDAATRYKVLAAFDGYLETLPESSLTRPDSYRVKDVVGRRGIGIGSAGLPSYNILLEGHSDALENDVVIYIKQAQTPAVSRHITDSSIREYFQHEGHRTVISQRALQAHADPWLGWTELDGAGQLVAEVSPYAVDLDWGDIDDPEEIAVGRRRPRPGHGHDARGRRRRERPLGAGAVLHGASHRRGDRGRRGRFRGASWWTSRTATAHARVPTTRSSWTCSVTDGFRVCNMLLGLKPEDSGRPDRVAVPLRGTASCWDSVASCFFALCQNGFWSYRRSAG